MSKNKHFKSKSVKNYSCRQKASLGLVVIRKSTGKLPVLGTDERYDKVCLAIELRETGKWARGATLIDLIVFLPISPTIHHYTEFWHHRKLCCVELFYVSRGSKEYQAKSLWDHKVSWSIIRYQKVSNSIMKFIDYQKVSESI